MELTNEVYNSINNYFSILSHTGYKSYSEVYKLLVFSFIEEMLNGPMSQYVTEKDYTIVNNALYCLYGSCMIPFPDYKKTVDNIVHRLPDEYRITENNIIRSTEQFELRVKS